MFQVITSQDIHRSMRAEFYNNLIAGLTQAELDRAEQSAIALCQSKLRGRYDYTAILASKPILLVEWIVSIYLYHLHRRQNPRVIPEDIGANYDQCIDWLNAIRDGKEHPDLPLITDQEGNPESGTNDLRFGSKESQTDGDFYI
jgi:phage gp36-like protein